MKIALSIVGWAALICILVSGVLMTLSSVCTKNRTIRILSRCAIAFDILVILLVIAIALLENNCSYILIASIWILPLVVTMRILKNLNDYIEGDF